MLPNPVEQTIEGAKNTLDKAHNITNSPEGNPVPMMGSNEFSAAPYGMVHKIRNTVKRGINPGIS